MNVKVDVLLICALKDEYEQVLNVTEGLDESGWQQRTLTNGWIVADGSFATPTGEVLTIRTTHTIHMGSEQAQAIASLLIDLQPQCIAMSGVCAGWRGKLALGDVIFADRLWCYDAGKHTVKNGKRKFQGDIVQYCPPDSWVQRMQHLSNPAKCAWLDQRPVLPLEHQEDWVLLRIFSEDNPCNHSNFKSACPQWSEVLPRLWQRKWLDKSLNLTEIGRERANELSMLHPHGLPAPTKFQIHVAPIATGVAVTEDPDIFPRLAQYERKVLGLDMEAYGLGVLGKTHDLPVLVAKGVQDYADGFKDDRYREFAARAAAECLISLLRNSTDLLSNRKGQSSKHDDKNSSEITKPATETKEHPSSSEACQKNVHNGNNYADQVQYINQQINHVIRK